MELKVNGFLKMDELKNANVIAGWDGIDNIVSGITIMEAPDIANWLKGGELLLTSSYTIHSFNDKDQEELMQKLAQKEISAVAVKIRKVEEKLPQRILDCGNKFKIPIIQLPREIPFIDIMNPVMGELFNSQVRKLSYYKEVHDRFTALALSDEALEAIPVALENLIQNPIAIYDRNFKCIVSTDPNINNFTILEQFTIQDQNYQKNKDVASRFTYYKQRVVYSKLDNKERNQVVIPIRTVNNIKTYLVVAEINRKLEELDYIAIENATTILCLELVKQFSVAEVERKFRNDLIDDLVTGKINSLDKVYQRANLIGLDLDRHYAIVLFNIDNYHKFYSKTNEKNCNEFKTFESKIHNVLYETISCFLPDGIIRIGSDRVTILWGIEKEKINDEKVLLKIRQAIEKIQKRIKKQMKDLSFTTGISNIAKTISDIPKSYKEAEDALNLGLMINGKESITTFSQLGILRLLCQFNDLDSLSNFIPQSLKKLIEYDESNKNELMNTLETFLKNNGNAAKTSKDLFIHYKTVTYRLDRIKEITKIDFDNYEEMLEVQLGLKILRLINKR